MEAISISTESPSFCRYSQRGSREGSSDRSFFFNVFFKAKRIRMCVSDLVVDLQLHQCGVAGHGLDDGHHAICGDEVGLNIKTLQAGVLL